MRTRNGILAAAAAVLAGLFAAPSLFAQNSTGSIVCWTDDRGQRACGDHVPAEYSQKQRQIYNQRGMLVQTVKAAETPEQRAEDERKQREELRALQQQQNDNFMLQTYSNVGELKAMRDNRLQTYDVRIELAEKAVRDGAASLKDLQDRADVEHEGGAEPNPELLNQIKSFENSQADNIRALAQIKQDRETAATQFDHDIQRYQELRGMAPSPAPATPQAPQPLQAPAPAAAPAP